MAKKQEEEAKGGLPAWMGTYGDMMTLLLCFFVLLFSMSSVDVRKFQETIASFNNQIDIMPGGEALTEGDRINNGVTQLTDIEILVQRALEQTEGEIEESESKDAKDISVEDAEVMMWQKAEDVAEDVHKQLSSKGLSEEVEIAYSLNFVKITLPGEALFDSASADIKVEAFPIIEVIGEIVNGQSYKDYNVLIEGHTDDVPINTTRFPSNKELSSSRAIAIGNYLIDSFDFDEQKLGWTGYGEYRPVAPNDSAENRAMNRRVEIKIILQTEEVDMIEYDALTEVSDETETVITTEE